MTTQKYKVSSFKTRSAYIKTGRYFQPPVEVESLSEAKILADELVKKHKVYMACVDVNWTSMYKKSANKTIQARLDARTIQINADNS